jgi:hypothetical protein
MRCPDCKSEKKVKKFGFYKRKSDSRKIQRFICKRCHITFSNAIKDPAYNQNKRRINNPLLKMFASSVSGRRAAIILGVSRTTIARKLIYLADLCRAHQAKLLASIRKVEDLQFDELQTIEHTKCKPLSVAIAVDEKTRTILGTRVSSMPATGYLAAISRRKYGYRPDKRVAGLNKLFQSIKKVVNKNAFITSDEHPFYGKIIKNIFPYAVYKQFKGEKGTVAGQGELKKVTRDPLFAINHTLAMCRANINRLVRRTWCTTKKPERLADHLAIYMWFHNTKLTQPSLLAA